LSLDAADAEAVTDRGFTLIELLVAGAVLLAVMGPLVSLAISLRDGVERSLGAADLTAGSRMVIERVAGEIREAGSRASVGGPRLADVVTPLVPLATVDSTAWADTAQAIRITRVPGAAAQGRLLSAAAVSDVTVILDTSARCTAVGAGCGLQPGTAALLYDESRAVAVVIAAVASGGVVRLTSPLPAAFPAGSVLASATATTYGLRPSADGASSLVRAASGAEQPLLDDVVGFVVRVRGPDPNHPRVVDLSLRVEARAPSLRGPAGRLFRRGGTATRPASWVPDVEINTSIALRNGAG
jgi:prepilin-type N-terminal cleavage/methylation domain-containing protein